MLLAIETSSACGSVALVGADGVQAYVSLEAPRDHAQKLAPTVRELLAGRFDALTGYALSIGPGSFTGLRVGVAFAKGIAVACPRPAVAVSSLRVLAAGAAPEDQAPRRLAILDARRGNVFAGIYEGGQPSPELADGLYELEQIEARFGAQSDLLWVGDGVPLLRSAPASAPEDRWVPNAQVLGRLAWPMLMRGETVDPSEVSPVYHQLSAAELSHGIRAVP